MYNTVLILNALYGYRTYVLEALFACCPRKARFVLLYFGLLEHLGPWYIISYLYHVFYAISIENKVF